MSRTNCGKIEMKNPERLQYPKMSKYNLNTLLGNWFEESSHYNKHNYIHCTEYSQEYIEKPRTKVPDSVVWDNKIQSEGYGIHPVNFNDETPNYFQNFSTLYDLSYNHFPKIDHQRKCLHNENPDALKSYGNLTNYGTLQEKREEWKYQKVPVQYTMNEIDFTSPEQESYKFERWTRPTAVKAKYGTEHRPYPSDHPSLSHLNPITWCPLDYQNNTRM